MEQYEPLKGKGILKQVPAWMNLGNISFMGETRDKGSPVAWILL